MFLLQKLNLFLRGKNNTNKSKIKQRKRKKMNILSCLGLQMIDIIDIMVSLFHYPLLCMTLSIHTHKHTYIHIYKYIYKYISHG